MANTVSDLSQGHSKWASTTSPTSIVRRVIFCVIVPRSPICCVAVVIVSTFVVQYTLDSEAAAVIDVEGTAASLTRKLNWQRTRDNK